MFKVINKEQRYGEYYAMNKISTFSSVSIVEFEQVNVCLEEGYYNHVPSTTGSHLF